MVSRPRTLVDSVQVRKGMDFGRHRGWKEAQFRIQEGYRVVRDVLDEVGEGRERRRERGGASKTSSVSGGTTGVVMDRGYLSQDNWAS